MANAAPTFKYNNIKHTNIDRPSAYRRGYGGKRWLLSRQQVFLRDNYTCKLCGRLCIERSADWRQRPHCDHIIPASHGGGESLDNKQTLCGSCNARKARQQSQTGGQPIGGAGQPTAGQPIGGAGQPSTNNHRFTKCESG